MKLSALALSKGLPGPAHADGDVALSEPLAIGDGGVLHARDRSDGSGCLASAVAQWVLLTNAMGFRLRSTHPTATEKASHADLVRRADI